MFSRMVLIGQIDHVICRGTMGTDTPELVPTVEPPVGFELLPQSREVVVGQHGGIQSVHSLPGVRGGVARLAVELHGNSARRQRSS